ncbi:junctional sarcoplasmic reticulum protein 1 [Suncus etruscus]|uniref:junctional sarcoplasmic reticulum protein 1 n=1 Tax=Suncus etruscus TaxID=109475 RepID=UPI00210FBFAC|nr:junctional sarcoplasmic reticulum protein 1 [Suncus etruscus]
MTARALEEVDAGLGSLQAALSLREDAGSWPQELVVEGSPAGGANAGPKEPEDSERGKDKLKAAPRSPARRKTQPAPPPQPPPPPPPPARRQELLWGSLSLNQCCGGRSNRPSSSPNPNPNPGALGSAQLSSKGAGAGTAPGKRILQGSFTEAEEPAEVPGNGEAVEAAGEDSASRSVPEPKEKRKKEPRPKRERERPQEKRELEARPRQEKQRREKARREEEPRRKARASWDPEPRKRPARESRRHSDPDPRPLGRKHRAGKGRD